MERHKSIASREVQAAITRLAAGIAERHAGHGEIWLLGIANGGVALAARLAAALRPLSDLKLKTGTLDISFHRDDLGRHPIPKEFSPSELPGDVTGALIVLVDDVLFTGRTVKAALDELFDHGRPARVELAVLVDRGQRRLPVAPDYVGLTLAAAAEEEVTVTLAAGGASGADAVRIAPAQPCLPVPPS